MIITSLGIWSNSQRFTHNTVLLWAQNSHCTVRTGLRHWRQGCQRALLFSTDSSSECPNSKLLSLQTPYPTSVLYCGKWRLLSLIPPHLLPFFCSLTTAALNLSSADRTMPQEEGTQGQIRLFGDSRFSFFVSYSWPHALLCCILSPLRCRSPRLFTQNCVFCASWSKEKCLYDFLCSAVRVEN